MAISHKTNQSESSLWKNPVVSGFAGSALALAAFSAIAWGVVPAFTASRAQSQAQKLMERGFTALATDLLDQNRQKLTQKRTGCVDLMNAYFKTENASRLEWASQACLEAGHDIVEAHLGLAAARELAGRDDDAAKILANASQKFEKSPDPLYRLANLLKRNKRNPEAGQAFLRAMERAPENQQIALDALVHFSQSQMWTQAKPIADRFKNVQIDNPEIKLIIARALINGGDAAAGRTIASQARQILDQKPELKPVFEKAYGDVLGTSMIPKAH